jgi:bis(5'-adenosyl)-triphosphatase
LVVFFISRLSLGIVNLKPLLPGRKYFHSLTLHTDQIDVLVLPRRVVPRLADLNPEEVTDLFLSVQHVGKVLEKAYNAQSLTVSIQDGKEAGQSVPHVHVHLIPRKSTDYGGDNDQIYSALEENEKGMKGDMDSKRDEWKNAKDEDREPRTMEEMENEAEWLKGLFTAGSKV